MRLYPGLKLKFKFKFTGFNNETTSCVLFYILLSSIDSFFEVKIDIKLIVDLGEIQHKLIYTSNPGNFR